MIRAARPGRSGKDGLVDARQPERRLALLVILAVLLFNFPILAVIDRLAACCLPGLLPVYLFGAWAAIIGLMALLHRQGGRG